MKEKKMKCWKVTRTVIETFEVYGYTKAEAMNGIQNPHTITIKKEVIKQMP